jgi:hypothetical protein
LTLPCTLPDVLSSIAMYTTPAAAMVSEHARLVLTVFRIIPGGNMCWYKGETCCCSVLKPSACSKQYNLWSFIGGFV